MLDIIDHAAIREIRLARPPVNALSLDLLRNLTEAVRRGAEECEALVISGQPKVFTGGLDVPAMLQLDRAGVLAVFNQLWHAQQALALAQVPVVFAITGHCPAGGTVLAIHADYRVMATGDFRLGLNEVQVGLYPGTLITGAFRRLVGGHAAQLLTRGALVDPPTALRMGLVDELCEPADVVARALTLAREWCALPREAMSRTRALVRRDLVQLFGAPADADILASEFAATGADYFCVPETQERLRQMFARKR